MDKKLILVTGATGYIASQLIPQLLKRGYRVRALAREPQRLKGRYWYRSIEIIPGDVMHPDSLARALDGVWTAYYLIHNMASGRGYTAIELDGARNFAKAAETAGVEHIIYLGGLADPNGHIAAHMRSRIETGNTLRCGRVPVTEFRAGVIVGPGSISFEMIRFLCELFPILPGPAWLRNRSQPISAQNVLDYLLTALDNPNGRGQIFEIGGPETMTYAESMLRFARLRGLRRWLFTVPGIPVWLMAWLVNKVTPVPEAIARALIEGLLSDSLVRQPAALQIFPNVNLIPYDAAVSSSLAKLHPSQLEPVWTDGHRPVVSIRHEGFLIDHRCLHVAAPPEAVFRVITSLGGEDGWLYADWLWKLRGWLDHLILPHHNKALKEKFKTSRSSRLRGSTPNAGDHLDFYRVEAIEPHRLLLYSELKAPGEGWMEWRVESDESNGSLLTQTGYFAPRGLPGFIYWYLLYPFHMFIFNGLLRTIAKKSTSLP